MGSSRNMTEPQKPKKGKKRKRVAENEEGEGPPRKTITPTVQDDERPLDESPQPSKKNRTPAQVPNTETSKDVVTEEDADKAAKKHQRFVVFIGNLPYSATTDTISKHFSKLHPTSVRHSTNKDTGKSRGFAFVEFEGYDRMKTCLKFYHHSNFDDGLSPARKINVELTAGGGGSKSKHRKTKLREKNYKLSQERTRATQGTQKDRKEGDAEPAVEEGASNVQEDNIHPSRRTRVRAR